MLSVNPLHYPQSAPFIVSGSVTAPLVAGEFVFDPRNQVSILQGSPNLSASNIYLFDAVSVAVDVSEIDYKGAILTTPQISIYDTSKGRNPVLNNPIPIPMYYDQEDFKFFWNPAGEPVNLLLGVRGKLLQTASLVGKTELTMTIKYRVYDMGSEQFRKAYAKGGLNG